MSKIYETALRITATISKTFRGDIGNAARAMTGLGAAAKRTADAVNAAKTKYNTATEALRRLEAAEKAAGGATKESIKWRKAGEKAIAATTRELDRATKAAEKNAAAIRNANKAQFASARERLFGKAGTPAPLFQKAGQQIKGIASDVFFLGTAAAGAGTAMAGLVLHTLKTADEIGDTADKLGIGAVALQELRYGAEQAGAETQDLDRGLAKMAITIGKFKAAKGKSGGGGGGSIPGLEMLGEGGATAPGAEQNPFKRIGLDAKKLAQLSPEAQLKKITEGMQNLKTHADKAAVAQAIFGKGATALLPFLEEGAAGIERYQKAAHKYGGVLSAQDIANADAADKALRDVKMAVFGLASSLGAALLPTATKTFGQFSAFVSENRGQIQKWGENAARWIEDKGIPGLKKFGSEAITFAQRMVSVVDGVAKLVGGFDRLGYVIVGLRLAPLATTLAKISFQAFKAADGMFKFAEAAKGADAPGLGMAGKAIGAAATAAMVVEAATVGYAIGTAIDNYFGLSERLSRFAHSFNAKDEGALSDTEAQAHSVMLKRKSLERDTRVRQFQAQGLSYGQALYAADHPDDAPTAGSAKVNTRGGGARVNVAPVVHIHGGERDDVSKGMDRAKSDVLRAYDEREKNRKRVAFGDHQ